MERLIALSLICKELGCAAILALAVGSVFLALISLVFVILLRAK